VNFLDITKMAWEGVKSRKFRFLLNIIGIMIGCTAVTGLMSITQGLSNNISDQLQILGPQTIIVIPGRMTTRGFTVTSPLTWRDVSTIQRLPLISMATPIIANRQFQYAVKGEAYSASVYGITEEYAEINKSTELSEGRQILRSDSGVAIIGANVAQPTNKDSPILEIGSRINVEATINGQKKTMTLRVIGITKKTGGSFGANLDDSIAIPLRDADSFFETGGKFTYIMAKANSMETVNSAANQIKDNFGKTITAYTYETANAQVQSVLGTIQAVLGGIAAISLIVAGVGIINTMTISVLERTKEIGTLKALGAKSRNVLLMFITESVLTGIVGGAIGAVFGMFLSDLIGRIIGLAAAPSLLLGTEVVGFAVITSVLSGLYPAWRASNLSPVEALRYE